MPSHNAKGRSLVRRTGVSFLLVSFVGLQLAGCVTTGQAINAMGVSTQDQRIGPDDGKDSCRPYLVALDSTGDYYGEDMLKGALMGAAAGAGLGALLKGDMKSALMGAAAGAAVGALGGYWMNKVQQGEDQAVLDLQNDMIKDGKEIDKTQEALKKLISCRTQTADKIRSDLKTKRIPRTEAESQMASLKILAAKDAVVWDRVRTGMNKRMDEYKFAVAELEKPSDDADAPEPKKSAPPPASRKKEVKAVESDDMDADADTTTESKPAPKKKSEASKKKVAKKQAKEESRDTANLLPEKKKAQKILTSTQSKWAPTEKMGNDYVQNISTGFTLSSESSWLYGPGHTLLVAWSSAAGDLCRLDALRMNS
ncbi:MAG: hypothetical protein HQL64_00100 [Magnetococcales bacterium]|nr:hypothetical protein [Magnetococcales bacterium]